jgi:hypothetical protein
VGTGNVAIARRAEWPTPGGIAVRAAMPPRLHRQKSKAPSSKSICFAKAKSGMVVRIEIFSGHP